MFRRNRLITRTTCTIDIVCYVLSFFLALYFIMSGINEEMYFIDVRLRNGSGIGLAFLGLAYMVVVIIGLVNSIKYISYMDVNHLDSMHPADAKGFNAQTGRTKQPNNRQNYGNQHFNNQYRQNYNNQGQGQRGNYNVPPQFVIFTCGRCGTNLRIPCGKGRVQISCPNCRNQFFGNT